MSNEAKAFLKTVLGDNEELEREGLLDTPARLTKALRQMTSGYSADIDKMMTTFPSEGDAVVCVRDIPFASLCEHHVLPFSGFVSVAYIPGERIVGLSKIPRLVHAYARRLQVQERLGTQIAEELTKRLNPAGVAVVIRGAHSCMRLRGVESAGDMVTSTMRGVFMDEAEARAEVMRLFNLGGLA